MCLIGTKGDIDDVRILGPVRNKTQVEISRTDGYRLGIDPPIRDSGDLAGSASLEIEGPKGKLRLAEGVIIAARHLHATPADAEKLGLKDGEKVEIAKPGERGVIFRDVLVRVKDSYTLEFHIDTDEANAASITSGDSLYLQGEYACGLEAASFPEEVYH